MMKPMQKLQACQAVQKLAYAFDMELDEIFELLEGQCLSEEECSDLKNLIKNGPIEYKFEIV